MPLALTQNDVMGAGEESRSSGLVRLARRADLIGNFLAAQLGRPAGDLAVLVAASALSGAVSAAWSVWAADGVARHPLHDYVASAIDMLGLTLERA